MIRVVTISREFGSGGGAVARLLAERLHWKLIDDPLVAEIAHLAKVPPDLARRLDERVDPWFHRITKALWRGGYEANVSRCEADAFDADAMADLWNRVIRESAALGNCVAVGRGGMCLLGGRSDTLHVAVRAPIETRVHNLRERLGRGANAKAEAEESDARRGAYIQRYFGQDWRDYRLYDLVLDSRMGFDAAVNAILCAAGLAKAVSETPMHR
jgi:cytidylate kinase